MNLENHGMKGSKQDRFYSLVFLVLLFNFIFWTALSYAASPIKIQRLPMITFDNEQFDFGKVEEGIKLQHTFQVKNSGQSLLNIKTVFASCGCTQPHMKKTHLEPSEVTDLDITVDTSMKKGKITKSVYIYSNDPTRPSVTLNLLLDVKDPHSEMGTNIQAKIFTDAHCATCHVNKGIGHYGKELYAADCAMCHGNFCQGIIGPSLIGPYNNPEFAAMIKDTIAQGSKTHPSMPGFLKDHGGPLSQRQIDSIVAFLHQQSKEQSRK